MKENTTIAVDIAKNVFEAAVSVVPGQVRERRRLTRAQLPKWVAQREPSTVVMEACGSAHYFGREFEKQGHKAVLLPPAQVRRYVLRNKTDRTDTMALLEAYRNEDIKPVPVKTEYQQALAWMHRVRTGWKQTRTGRLNAMRGVLRELGITIPVGATKVVPAVVEAVANEKVPPMLRAVLLEAVDEVRQLEKRISAAEDDLVREAKTQPAVGALMTVPGIGILTATALFCAMGEPTRFASGRRFASFLGLVPREHSSGDRRHLGAITKRGDPYIRMLLTHGARSALLAAKRKKSNDRLRTWALSVEQRRGHNRATMALANKMARIAWAIWSRGGRYAPGSDPITDARTNAPIVKG